MNSLKIEPADNSKHLIMELWHSFSKVYRNGKKRIEQELEKHSIKTLELRLLFSISKEGKCPIGSLASEINVTSAWVTGIVEELENRNLVKKLRNPNDRRIIDVSLTPAGKKLVKTGMKIYEDLVGDAIKGLSLEELKEFERILMKVNSSIQSSD
jgi:MarR family 2-MHQ and catechol resistance regulon transcriptional repressor